MRAFKQRVSAMEGHQAADLEARAARQFRTHQEVLTALLETVPPAARPAIKRAIEASRGAGPSKGIGPPKGAGPPDEGGPAARPSR